MSKLRNTLIILITHMQHNGLFLYLFVPHVSRQICECASPFAILLLQHFFFEMLYMCCHIGKDVFFIFLCFVPLHPTLLHFLHNSL